MHGPYVRASEASETGPCGLSGVAPRISRKGPARSGGLTHNLRPRSRDSNSNSS